MRTGFNSNSLSNLDLKNQLSNQQQTGNVNGEWDADRCHHAMSMHCNWVARNALHYRPVVFLVGCRLRKSNLSDQWHCFLITVVVICEVVVMLGNCKPIGFSIARLSLESNTWFACFVVACTSRSWWLTNVEPYDDLKWKNSRCFDFRLVVSLHFLRCKVLQAQGGV